MMHKASFDWHQSRSDYEASSTYERRLHEHQLEHRLAVKLQLGDLLSINIPVRHHLLSICLPAVLHRIQFS